MTHPDPRPPADGSPAGQLPELSIVVVPLAGGAALQRCLGALHAQRGAPPLEILVPHDDRVADLDAVRAAFGAVRFLRVAGGAHPARWRAAAVARARGRVVALTEDHCTVDPDWCASIAAAHADPPGSAIGGVVEKALPAGVIEWGIYLSDYARYMPPIDRSAAGCLTDCNVSYPRALLESIHETWRTGFHETTVHAALRARGVPLRLSQRMVVRQGRPLPLRSALADRFAHGRLFASLRLDARLQRAVYALGAPVLPVLLVARALRTVVRKRRHIGPALRATPALVALTAAWALGELAGYVIGAPERGGRSVPATVEPAEASHGV